VGDSSILPVGRPAVSPLALVPHAQGLCYVRVHPARGHGLTSRNVPAPPKRTRMGRRAGSLCGCEQWHPRRAAAVIEEFGADLALPRRGGV